jgi:hypothetical protein
VRILATTRFDPRVTRHLDQGPVMSFGDGDRRESADILEFLDNSLERSLGRDADRSRTDVRRIAAAAEGNFLYASLVLDELIPRLRQDPALEINAVALPPEGLDGLYYEFIGREATRDEGRLLQTFRLVLGLLVVAQQEGFTRTQLVDMSRKESEEVEQVLHVCARFLSGVLPEGPFSSSHRSFAEFLLSSDDHILRIDAQEMHRKIVDHYWSRFHQDWSSCDEYGLRWLAVHAAAAGEDDRVKELLGADWERARVSRGISIQTPALRVRDDGNSPGRRVLPGYSSIPRGFQQPPA